MVIEFDTQRLETAHFCTTLRVVDATRFLCSGLVTRHDALDVQITLFKRYQLAKASATTTSYSQGTGDRLGSPQEPPSGLPPSTADHCSSMRSQHAPSADIFRWQQPASSSALYLPCPSLSRKVAGPLERRSRGGQKVYKESLFSRESGAAGRWTRPPSCRACTSRECSIRYYLYENGTVHAVRACMCDKLWAEKRCSRRAGHRPLSI